MNEQGYILDKLAVYTLIWRRELPRLLGVYGWLGVWA